ncbi:ABC transporter substrate-binding protein [Acetilactobacillus jinshanensis]|uniref:ABC transporter substrate-binding protein n=1 Tax=Acetilactobacillus jinshanensis TaxID=1720083 RepID=UPI003AB12CA2
MLKHKKWLTLGVAALSLMGLTACSNQANGTNKHVHFSQSYTASQPATKKGNHSTLHVAEVNDAPFAGMSAPTLQSNQEDEDVYSPGGNGSLFHTNKNYEIVNGGLANLKLNKKKNTALITLKKNAKWSNGQKVTAKDVEYPYEIVANPKTKAQSFSNDMDDIKGMSAYHKGKASTISGITFPNGPKGTKTLIHFNHLTPAMKYAGNDFTQDVVEPYQYIKNVPISKLGESSQVRKHPIFAGPYKLKKQVQGESTTWVPNKYYYGKKPQIKHIDIQVVSSNNIEAAFKAKKYDFAFNYGIPSEQYPKIHALKDYSEVGTPDQGYTDFGFNVGHANKSGVSVMDPNSKMHSANLRKAMLYSINLDMIAKKLDNGIDYRGNTMIPPVFHKYHTSFASQPGYPYNMAKAKKLLKAAGYTKKNGSKYVTKPNGKPLVIHFGCMQGSSAAKATDEYFLQQWHKLGLDVKFTTGKPMEMNSFYSELQKPKQKAMDVFEASFGVGSEPTPTSMYGPDAADNMAHLNTKENTKLLNEMNDKKSFNLKHRIKIFHEWEKYMNKKAVYSPEFYDSLWTAVNHRVTGYSLSPSNNEFWSKLGLNSAKLK